MGLCPKFLDNYSSLSCCNSVYVSQYLINLDITIIFLRLEMISCGIQISVDKMLFTLPLEAMQ